MPDSPEIVQPQDELSEALKAGATAEADQVKAELRVTAACAGFYFAELLKSHTPEDLARDLVREWHEMYLLGD